MIVLRFKTNKMKKVVLLLLLFASVFSLHAQTDKTRQGESVYQESVTEEDEILTIMDTNPEFPGGRSAFYSYIWNNLQYPDEARKNKITGCVYVTFVVEKDGSISSAKLLNDIGYGCGEEALRVVRNMPRWEPGTINGKPVRALYNLPLDFQP